MTKKQRKMLIRILLCAGCLILLQLLPLGRIVRFLCYLGTYYLIGYDILWKAFKGIRNRRIFDENFLMAVATIGAFLIAIYENGNYLEAIFVMLFYQIGEWFQSYAVGRSRKNISALMDIRPDYANIEIDGNLQQVDPDEVAVGDVIVVNPGEKVPIDGIVLSGESTLNTSALTGESIPREVMAGSEILSGCINQTGVLRVRTTKEFGESTVSQILDLVENASSRKSKSENFISKFARIYTPIVCYSALALAILPSLVQLLILGETPTWGTWIYRALTFLIISCPCALVISIPLSFFAGIGGASREGILIKGSNFLESMSEVKYVIFDKTGTLTKGMFEVTEIVPVQMEESELIRLAAYAESASSHPIAKSILRAYEGEINRSKISDVQEFSGKGILANIAGQEVLIGNEKLMQDHKISYSAAPSVGTVLYLAVNQTYQGYLVVSDVVKENAKEAILRLKKLGMKKTVMLTGDQAVVADSIAQKLGIDEVFSELLPADKVSHVEEYINSISKKEKLAYVGDGINDAPVLSRADIGIAMGAMGSDAAIEAADLVLMDDNPMKIVQAVLISKKCMRIVYENITFSLAVKFVCLLLGALGYANMYLAIFADVGVMVLAVLNAIRCLCKVKVK